MASWKYKLDLTDVFHNEKLSFEQKRDVIVGRIKASQFYVEDDVWLDELVGSLADSDNLTTFDSYWDEFYDYADYTRVWVATF